MQNQICGIVFLMIVGGNQFTFQTSAMCLLVNVLWQLFMKSINDAYHGISQRNALCLVQHELSLRSTECSKCAPLYVESPHNLQHFQGLRNCLAKANRRIKCQGQHIQSCESTFYVLPRLVEICQALGLVWHDPLCLCITMSQLQQSFAIYRWCMLQAYSTFKVLNACIEHLHQSFLQHL